MQRGGSWDEDTKAAEHAIDTIDERLLEQYLKIFTTFDSDHSGSIDVNEFRIALEKITCKKPTEASVRAAFDSVDSNNDGLLSRSEFVSWLETLRRRKARKDSQQ